MKRRSGIILLLIGLFSLCSIGSRSEARPKYSTVFETTYKNEYAGKDLGGKSCTICHDKTKDNKYLSNNYAEAISELLTRKNATEENMIQSALKSAEDKDSAVEGKTFGDLIREGRLPASK